MPAPLTKRHFEKLNINDLKQASIISPVLTLVLTLGEHSVSPEICFFLILLSTSVCSCLIKIPKQAYITNWYIGMAEEKITQFMVSSIIKYIVFRLQFNTLVPF